MAQKFYANSKIEPLTLCISLYKAYKLNKEINQFLKDIYLQKSKISSKF